MPKEEWGVKRVCPNCSTRFYDLQRDPMTCPGCGHSFDLETLSGNRTRLVATESKDKKRPEPAVEIEDDAEVLDDDDNDVDLGDDVLEDDDDDTVDIDDLADVAADDDDS
jgi:uncharacterized protein (TIGR02300 family)